MDREGAQRAMAVLDEQEDQALAAQAVAAIAMRRVEPEPVVPQPRHDEQQKLTREWGPRRTGSLAAMSDIIRFPIERAHPF